MSTRIEIINNPELKSPLKKVSDFGLSTLLWGVWLYLLLPLINLLIWFLLGYRFHKIVLNEPGYMGLKALLISVSIAVVALSLSLLFWGAYNYYLYGGNKNRRKETPPTTVKEMAAYFNLSINEVKKMQEEKEYIWAKSNELITSKDRS